MAQFDVNTDALIELTAKLGKLHKSALPVAIRGTLNDAAFETKRRVPQTASRKFTTRNRSFFRAFSSVQKAGGFDINAMQAAVGIDSSRGSKVAEGLEKQETGGAIKGRKLIPHDKGRVSGSHSKRMRAKHKFRGIKIHDVRKKTGGRANYILIKRGSKGTVFEVKQTGRKRKLTPVYTYRNTKISRVRPRPFMKPATMLATKNMARNYVQQAERQIQRLAR
jgi:hypothetical protein